MKTFRQFILEVDDDKLLRRFARMNKVDLDIDDYGDRFDIHHIHREPFRSYNREPDNPKTKGAGAKVMRAVSKIADRGGKRVKLYPANSDLRHKYYPQFGFKNDEPGYDDEDDFEEYYHSRDTDPEMVRDPRPYSRLTAQQRYQRAEDSKKRKAAQQAKQHERHYPGQKQFNFKGKKT